MEASGRASTVKYFPHQICRSTRTASSAFGHQGAGGNSATVGQRQRKKREGRHIWKQQESRKGRRVEVRVGTLNVLTMTGKVREMI